MKKIILTILLCSILVFGTTGCGTKMAEEQPQDQIQESGNVLKETADVLVAKFNTEVVDNSTLNPASNDYLTTDEEAYWYGLITGVYLIVYPLEFTGNLNNDIVDYMVLYVKKNSEYASNTNEYMKYLIQANNSDITDTEVDELIKSAKESSKNGTTVNNGKGIDIGYVENEDNYQYQVIRLYEWLKYNLIIYIINIKEFKNIK